MTKYLFYTLNLIFSVFLYANVYEKIFNTDLPFISSITKFPMPSQVFAQRVSNNSASQDKWAGFYGEPISLRLPKLKMSLDIQKPSFENNAALVTNLSAYYYTYSKSYSGLLGNTLIFAASGAKPFDYIGLLVEGDRVIVTTDKGWNYTYKVVKKQTLTSLDNLSMDLESSVPRVLLYKVIGLNTYLVVEADYTTVSPSGNSYDN